MKAKVFKYKSDGIPSWLLIWNWSRMRRMYISPCRERTKTGMKTMTVSMWSAGLKTFIFPAGSIHAGFSREKVAERKPPPIAGTGSRIRFRMRKEEPSSGLISVRVFEALGLDATPLVQAREAYKKEAGTETQGAGGERGGRAQSAGRATSAAAR